MDTLVNILLIVAIIELGIIWRLLLTKSQKQTIGVEVLKEIKKTMETVNKLIDNFNQHNKILIDYDENFKKIFNIELGFNSEIKQLKNAVAQLQNMVIDANLEEE